MHRFGCRKKKLFSQITQRNFRGRVFNRVRTKIDPMLRAEYIFSALHQGHTYSPENNVFFVSPWIHVPIHRGESWEIRSKETRGKGG